MSRYVTTVSQKMIAVSTRFLQNTDGTNRKIAGAVSIKIRNG